MAKTERTYNVPLRKEFQKAPNYRRAKKAVAALREFLQRHMKSDDVRLGNNLNNKMWEHGIRNPPHHVKVTAVKDDDGVVKVELFGYKYEELTKDEREKKLEEKKPKKEDKQEDDIKELEKTLESATAPEKPAQKKAAETAPAEPKADEKPKEEKPKKPKAKVPRKSEEKKTSKASEK